MCIRGRDVHVNPHFDPVFDITGLKKISFVASLCYNPIG